MTTKIEQLYTELLVSFMKLLELRNPYNIDHCKLVSDFSGRLAEHCGFDEESREKLKRAAEIHTLGVLLQMEEKQKGRDFPISGLQSLTGREHSSHLREQAIFSRILDEVPYYNGCKEILVQRHEWFDGSGSVYGLSGSHICAEARLLAVADAYVDLVTPKAHRPSESSETALKRIKELSGTQFDPSYVSALVELFSDSDDEERSARNQKFREAHCRHYLSLGHFYTQIHETDWALRSYVAAQRMAEEIAEPGLRLASISGQFMVFCDLNQLERARETLRQVRLHGSTERDKLGYQLLWGLLEWLSGKELGEEILARVIEQHENEENLPGLIAALGFQACMTLFSEGSDGETHLRYLKKFLDVASSHDLFDVVERYRPFTIPVLLNAVVQGLQEGYARNTLTIMGEPCQGPLHERLKDAHPSKWTKILMPESSLGLEEPEPAVEESRTEYDLRITTMGDLAFQGDGGVLGSQDWQTQKTIRLFLRLARDARRPLNAESLAEELWPDAGPQKARDSLRNCAHQLRRSVKLMLSDKERKITTRSRKNNTITFELSSRFDFQDFEEAVTNGQKLFAEGSLEQAHTLMTEALDAHKGEFLDGFDDEWIQAKRAQLWNLRIEGLTVLGQCLVGAAKWTEAEACANELLQLDDLREQSHALLILAVGKAGRSSEAVELYEKACELFEDEIGVAPKGLRQPLEELELLL